MKIQKLRLKMILASLVSTVVTTQAAGMGTGGCMMGCTSTTIIDPPRGCSFHRSGDNAQYLYDTR